MTTEANKHTEENVKLAKEIFHRKPVYYVPVLDKKLKNIIRLETAIHKIEDDKKVLRLETELEELRQKTLLTKHDHSKDLIAMRRKIKNARIANANRLNKNFVYRVNEKSKNKKSAHASAAASCAKRFLNNMVRMCAKCDRVRYQLFDLDNITNEAYELGLLEKHIQTNMFADLKQFDDAFKLFIECNQCQDMNQFDLFCKKNNLNDDQRKFFLTTKYQQKLKSAERKKGNLARDHPPLILQEEDDATIIPKYFTPKFKIFFKLEDEYLDSITIDIQRRDEKTNEILKILTYKLDACFREVRNKAFKVYGASQQTESNPVKLVPCWMQNVKITSVKNVKNNKNKKKLKPDHGLTSETDSDKNSEDESASEAESVAEVEEQEVEENKSKKQKINHKAYTSNDQ